MQPPLSSADTEESAGPGLSDPGVPRRWWPIVLPVTVLAIAVSLILPAGRHEWALSMFRQPTPYTALSFSNPTALPRSVSGSEPIRLSFQVVNQEGHTVNYRYILSVLRGSHSAVLANSVKPVAPGADWNVSATVRPACGKSECRITVSLPGYPETIDFTLNSKV
jgi:hypothetical protein